jgi:hypothetical protein
MCSSVGCWMDDGTQAARLTDRHRTADQPLGDTVAISSDARTIVVDAPDVGNDLHDAAYVYSARMR